LNTTLAFLETNFEKRRLCDVEQHAAAAFMHWYASFSRFGDVTLDGVESKLTFLANFFKACKSQWKSDWNKT
jgi:hypothetical protein